ncbi:MAG: redox-regulated ATPase YchF [Candidatus Nealsonbacteria bacterium]|nr:redox-regulated ATPase YchF [Candidatus Nealsonbacteria bacterium]
MSFSVGIVGLPNAGKSTLFKSLTKKPIDIASYPFTTISPNVGIVTIPDERLEKISEVVSPDKTTPTVVEFVDIAGLIKGAHKGEGLGNQFLAQIRECDAILNAVRAFRADLVEHTEKTVDPERDIEIIKIELIMKDMETAEKVSRGLEKDSKSKDKEIIKKLNLLKKINQGLGEGKKITEISLSEEEMFGIKEFQFLTSKPMIHVFNISDENPYPIKPGSLTVNLKYEEEISDLSEPEKKELGTESHLDQIILACYNALELITFYTASGKKEARAWTLKKGSTCPQAGSKIHSDFEKKFIRADVIHWDQLIKAGNWAKAKELGWLKTVGKDYIVVDGNVIEFKI